LTRNDLIDALLLITQDPRLSQYIIDVGDPGADNAAIRLGRPKSTARKWALVLNWLFHTLL